jgi:hypothetical protein
MQSLPAFHSGPILIGGGVLLSRAKGEPRPRTRRWRCLFRGRDEGGCYDGCHKMSKARQCSSHPSVRFGDRSYLFLQGKRHT